MQAVYCNLVIIKPGPLIRAVSGAVTITNDLHSVGIFHTNNDRTEKLHMTLLPYPVGRIHRTSFPSSNAVTCFG